MLQKRKKFNKAPILLCFFIILISGVLFLFYESNKKESTYQDSTKIIDTLSQVLDISTVKYNYSNIVTIKKDKSINDIKIPFTEKSFIIKYNGVINGGVKPEDIEIISNEENTIVIDVNKCQILDHYIDEKNMYVYDVKSSIFNKLDVQEVLDDIKDIETIPVVDIDLPTETLENVDVNYLKDNGVDVDHALELLGDMEMYNSTVSDFVSEVDDKWNRIVDYKNNSDMENYAIEVHSLKSDSKYLGLMKLADIAYQHELKSKEKDVNYVNEHFSELEDEFNLAMSIIKKYENSIKKD